jgi:excisionase family DNA binding protein
MSRQEPQRPLFYSTSEVAHLMSCSGEHVRNLIRQGQIKQHVGLGRKILIPAKEVDRLAGEVGIPGHEGVSSSRRRDVIRELRAKYAEIGVLLVQLEDED